MQGPGIQAIIPSSSGDASPATYSLTSIPCRNTQSMIELSIAKAELMVTKWNPYTSGTPKSPHSSTKNCQEAMDFIKCVFNRILSTNRAHLDLESISACSSRASSTSSILEYEDNTTGADPADSNFWVSKRPWRNHRRRRKHALPVMLPIAAERNQPHRVKIANRCISLEPASVASPPFPLSTTLLSSYQRTSTTIRRTAAYNCCRRQHQVLNRLLIPLVRID